jgi:hypothetical protein
MPNSSKILYIGVLFKVRFMEVCVLLRVRFRQVSLYIQQVASLLVRCACCYMRLYHFERSYWLFFYLQYFIKMFECPTLPTFYVGIPQAGLLLYRDLHITRAIWSVYFEELPVFPFWLRIFHQKVCTSKSFRILNTWTFSLGYSVVCSSM